MAQKSLQVLLLGGTAEGRALATLLDAEPGVSVITSLAGRVADPILPDGEVRIGGFGGPAGLADWLRAHHIGAIVDATHPFAVGMTGSAGQASGDTGLPLLRLQRPAWVAEAADRWTRVPSLAAAADALTGAPERVFLTTGRQGLAAFAPLHEHWFLVRSVNPPDPPVPARMLAVLDRGPFTVDGELALMRQHTIGVLVTKDSGGTAAAAKLAAARQLDLPVIMVDRPVQPDVVTVTAVADVMTWIRGLLPH
jgi:precorrin-6A/cobalt-precorrin-6A reductase